MPTVKTKRSGRQALIEAINRAYTDDPPTNEEKELLQRIRENQRKLLVGDRVLIPALLKPEDDPL